jgi:hypothetical protein
MDILDEIDLSGDEDVVEATPLVLHEPNLETLEETRREYARIYLDYINKRITRDRARTAGYLLSGLLAFHKTELDLDLVRRMEAIEERLDGRTE